MFTLSIHVFHKKWVKIRNRQSENGNFLLRNAWMVPFVARIARGFFEARPTVIEVALMQTFFPLVFFARYPSMYNNYF